jgi:hypothetical protein
MAHGIAIAMVLGDDIRQPLFYSALLPAAIARSSPA